MREVSHLIILGDKSLMKSIWRRHLIICLFLVLLAVPIYCLDLALLGGRGGGNWITLDFRGLIFWTYIALLAIHVTLSSIAVLLFPRSGALRIHFGSMVLSLILLVAGFVVYGKVLRAMHADNVRITLYLFTLTFREIEIGVSPHYWDKLLVCIKTWGVPRQLRIQYEGGIYHLMSPGRSA